jgi:hypothetical protein
VDIPNTERKLREATYFLGLFETKAATPVRDPEEVLYLLSSFLSAGRVAGAGGPGYPRLGRGLRPQPPQSAGYPGRLDEDRPSWLSWFSGRKVIRTVDCAQGLSQGRPSMSSDIAHWKTQLISLSPSERAELAHFLL